jgi:hypothetical protein
MGTYVECSVEAFELFEVPNHLVDIEQKSQFLLNNFQELGQRLTAIDTPLAKEAIDFLGGLYLVTYGELPKGVKKPKTKRTSVSLSFINPSSPQELEEYKNAVHGVKQNFIERFQSQVEEAEGSLPTIEAAAKGLAWSMSSLSEIEQHLTVTGTEG